MAPATMSYRLRSFSTCPMCAADVGDARTLGRRLNGHQGIRPTRKPGFLTTVQRCRRCGLVFANPMPVPHDLQDHYDMPVDEYWEQEPVGWTAGYFEPQIAEFGRLWAGSGRPVALDIGAGTGKGMVSLQRAGFVTEGLEPSRSFRDAAITGNGISPDALHLGGVEYAPYDAEAFDFVTFGAVLEHLPEPADALSSALRWLRPGGLIHAEVPSSDWLMARLVDAVYRVQGLDYTTHLSPLHAPYHLFEFTLDAFAACGRRLGYDIAFHRRFVGLTYAPGFLRPFLSAAMKATRTQMQIEVWMRKPTSAPGHA